jgi:hypothetical protein
LRAKADLDRAYAADLRRLTARWTGDLPARPSPAQSGSMVAGLCALRNAVLASASNTEVLAEKIDEQLAEPFLDAAAEAEQQARGRERECKNLCKELEQAMDHLAATKQALQRACGELVAAQAESGGAGGRVAASSSSSSDWMSDLLGSAVPMFRSSATDLRTKKIPSLDAKYVSAIKGAREMRAKFDDAIAAQLDACEEAEHKRLAQVQRMALDFTATHAACMQSNAKHMEAVRAAIAQCRPRKDLQLFLDAQVRRLGPDRKLPPPLPIYRAPKGHPNYRALASSSAVASAAARKSATSASSAKARRRAVDEPATDSDADEEDEDDDEEEEDLSLSDATDSEQDEEDDDVAAAENEDAQDSADAVAASNSLLSPTAEQLVSENSFTHLLAQLLSLPLDASAASDNVADGVREDLEAEVESAGQMLEGPAGRAALAAVLKRAVNSGGKSLEVAKAAIAAAKADADAVAAAAAEVHSPLLDARNGLDAVEPTAPASPEISAAASVATTVVIPTVSSSSSSFPSDPHATLTLSSLAFDLLSALLLRHLDACMAHMHAQPAISVLRSSRRLLLAHSADADGGGVAAAAEPEPALVDEEHIVVPSSTSSLLSAREESVLSRLSAHESCSSPRLWELAFLESLSRARRRKAPVHNWQTAAEQAGSDDAAAALAFQLLMKYANELLSLSQLSDAAVAAFVDKFACMHHLDSPTNSRVPGAVEQLLQLPCFTRLGLKQLPSVTKAAEAKRKLMAARKNTAPVASAAAASATLTGSASASSNSGSRLPVAMPVAAAPSPSAAATAAGAGSSAGPAKKLAGRSALHAPRPPFDSAFDDAHLIDEGAMP